MLDLMIALFLRGHGINRATELATEEERYSDTITVAHAWEMPCLCEGNISHRMMLPVEVGRT